MEAALRSDTMAYNPFTGNLQGEVECGMKTVGLISDTHGRLSAGAVAALAGCDHIIHAGDICGTDVLRELEWIAPVTAVLGNNDYPEYGEGVGRAAQPVIEGVRFLVAHYPRSVQWGYGGYPALPAGGPLPRVCVHGHTHIPEIVAGKAARPAELIVCPGSASQPRSGFPASVGKMVLDEGKVLSCEIVSLRGDVLMSLPKP